MKNNTSSKRAFTLIELLTVIAIIGVLAGMMFPAIQMGIRAAHKTRDTSAAKQIALAIIGESVDSGNNFRTYKDSASGDATKSIDIFQGLIDDKRIDNPNIFMGEGSTTPDSMTLKDANVGFQYVTGLSSTSSSLMPLVFTKGVGLTEANLTGKTFSAGTSAWKADGFVVAYVGGNAAWVANTKSSTDTIELARAMVFETVPASVKVLP